MLCNVSLVMPPAMIRGRRDSSSRNYLFVIRLGLMITGCLIGGQE